MAEIRAGGLGEARQDDAGHIGLQVADLFQQLHAGHFRHALVRDHDVEIDRPGNLERLCARLGFVDAVACFEEISQDRQVRLLIVDDQDTPTAGLPNAV